MTVRALASVVTVAATLSAPAPAQAYPDWRAPRDVGVAQEGVFRFPQAVAHDASGTRDPDPRAPAGPYVYVADQYSFFVQKFTAGGSFVRRFGGYGSEPGHFGATSASASPTTGTVGGIGGVAVDARGHVYVLDSFNSRVERFTAGGEFEGQFGAFGGAPGQLNPGINGGLALLGDDLFVGDQDNNRVQRFHLDVDGLPDGPPAVFGAAGTGPGQFDIVPGLAVDPARGHAVFVVDDRNNRIERFSAGGAFEALVGTAGSGPGQLDQPYDAGVDLAGRLFVADNQNQRVVRFDAPTLAYQTSFGAGPGEQPDRLNNVRGIAVAAAANASGGVFATNTSLNQIAEFGVDGAYIRSWGADGRGPAAFMAPRDVAVEPNGDVVVADTRADRVEVLRAGGAVETWAKISQTIHSPTSGAGKREFRDPTAVAVDPRNGDVYVAEGGGHRVQRIHQNGDIDSSVAYGGPSAGSAPGRFREPLGVAVGPDGAVWVADTRNDRLQRLDPQTGAWSVLTGFVRPTAVAVLADQRVAVTELGADAVLDPEGAAGAGRLSVIGSNGARVASYDGLDRPEGVAGDGHGGVLVAETQRDRLLDFRVADGRLIQDGEIGGPGVGAGRFARPMGMDIDAAGRLLVADTYNNRVQRFEAPAVSEPAEAGGTVPPALDLSLGAGGSFAAFMPGIERTYTTSVAVDVLSTAGDAVLTVADPSTIAPGRLVNGPYSLAQPLLAAGRSLPAVVKSWSAPASHEPVNVDFAQTIGASEPLRTGSYAKTSPSRCRRPSRSRAPIRHRPAARPQMTEDEGRALWMVAAPGRTTVAADARGVLETADIYANSAGPGAHVASASFIVASAARGRRVGRALVEDALAGASVLVRRCKQPAGPPQRCLAGRVDVDGTGARVLRERRNSADATASLTSPTMATAVAAGSAAASPEWRPDCSRSGDVVLSRLHYTTTESRTIVLTRRTPFVLSLLLAVTALAAGGSATAGAQPAAPREPDAPQSKSALRTAATAVPVSGSQTAVVITVRLNADDVGGTPLTVPDKKPPEVTHDVIETSRPWFERVSHGVFGGFFALSRGPVTVQTTKPVCSPEWLAEIGDQADAAIREREPNLLDPSQTGAVIYYFRDVKACSSPNPYAPRGAAGWGYFPPSRRVWLNGNTSLSVAVHELGHHLGLSHSGSQSCTDANGSQVPLGNSCTEQEYGDSYSAMGDHRSGQYSPSQLAQLGWNDGHVTTAMASSATTHYFLTTADSNAAGTTRALRLLDGGTTLWLEYRQYADYDESFLNYGLLVRREQTSLAGSPFLLTMNPPDGPFLNIPHPSMIVGQTWADPLGTMQITLDSADATGANVTIQPSITFKTVPNLLGRNTTAAGNAITAAGLRVGVVNTKVDDPLCEHVGNVITQAPAPGTHRPAGSRVDYVYAIEPSNGCLM